jgi:hypothetical protein
VVHPEYKIEAAEQCTKGDTGLEWIDHLQILKIR